MAASRGPPVPQSRQIQEASWRRVGRTLLRTLLIVLGYWSANRLAGFFEVTTYVSAAYLPAAVTFTSAMLLGAAYLPIMYLAVCAMAILIYGLPFAGLGYLDPLREVLVYGLAGLALRPIWLRRTRRVTLDTVALFLVVALLASLLSALALQFTPPFEQLLDNGETVIAFLGGDFAGIVLGVPAILMLRELISRPNEGGRLALSWSDAGRSGLYVIAGAFTAVFAAWLPATLQVQTQMMALLMFLPIVLAGLSQGARIGLIVAGASSVVYLHANAAWSTQHIQPIEMQMIFALSAALSLLSGAARDDKLFEWRQANFDALTGLPNRRMLNDRVEQEFLRAERDKKRLAILYIDLNDFKAVNDTLGHHAGDEVLIETGKRLRQCVRASDTVARLGGEVTVSGSVGKAVYPDDGDDFEALAKRADLAMYSAKKGAGPLSLDSDPA